MLVTSRAQRLEIFSHLEKTPSEKMGLKMLRVDLLEKDSNDPQKYISKFAASWKFFFINFVFSIVFVKLSEGLMPGSFQQFARSVS